MADGDSTERADLNENKKHTKQQRVLIGLGIGALVLTFILLRRSGSSSSGNNAALAQQQAQLAAQEAALSNGSYGAPGAIQSGYYDPTLAQILNALQGIQAQVAAGTPVSSPGGSTPQANSLPTSSPSVGLLGTTELAYLTQQPNQNPQLISDVTSAYNIASQEYGPTTAEGFHYSWVGPGQVQAVNQQGQLMATYPV